MILYVDMAKQKKDVLFSFRVERTIADWVKSIEETTGRSAPDILRQFLWNSYHITKKQELDARVTKEYYAEQLKRMRETIDRVYDFLSVVANRDTLAGWFLEAGKFFEQYGATFDRLFGSSDIQKKIGRQKGRDKKQKSHHRRKELRKINDKLAG